MPRDRQQAGPCPQCGASALTCTYNHFQDAAERIDSWEHRCLSYSYRDSKALRTPEGASRAADATTCPFCGRKGAATA